MEKTIPKEIDELIEEKEKLKKQVRYLSLLSIVLSLIALAFSLIHLLWI